MAAVVPSIITAPVDPVVGAASNRFAVDPGTVPASTGTGYRLSVKSFGCSLLIPEPIVSNCRCPTGHHAIHAHFNRHNVINFPVGFGGVADHPTYTDV